MNLFQVITIVSLIATVFIAVTVYVAQPHRRVNQCFFLLVSIAVVWLLALGWSTLTTTVSQAIFSIRLSSALSCLIPPAVFLLRLAVVKPTDESRRILAQITPWLTVSVLLFSWCLTPWFLVDAVMPETRLQIAEPVYGPGFFLFGIYMSGSFLALIWTFIGDISKARGIKRAEVQFLLLGCLSALGFGITAVLMPLILGVVELSQFLPFSMVIFNAIMAYGIATKSILDMPNVIRRLIAYSILILFLSALYLVVWYVTNLLILGYLTTSIPISHIIATLAVAFAMTPAQGRLQSLTNRLFLKSPRIDVGHSIQTMQRALNALSTQDELCRQFARMVMQFIPMEFLYLYLKEDGRYIRVFSSSPDGDWVELTESDPLVVAVAFQNEPLVRDLLPRRRPSPSLDSVEQQMQMMNIGAVAGIRSHEELVGIVGLGNRFGTQIYGTVELALITGLCDQFSLALEKNKLYQEVQNSRVYNSTLLENMLSGVIAASDQGVITVCNQEAARIVGVAPSVLTGQGVAALPKPLFKMLNDVLTTRREFRDVRLTLSSGPNNEVVLIAGCAGVRSHNGQSMGALLVFNDNTRVSKLEEQVRRTDRLASLGTLSAGMAHEIKNPLVTLKTFAQLLPDRYEDEDFRETFSGLIGSEINRIDGIVNQLLDFARPAKPTLEPIELHAVVDHTVKLLKQQFKQTGIQFVVDDQVASDRILGDSNLLAQALLNFFLNAMDAMEMGGVLTVRTSIVEPSSQATLTWQNERVVGYLRLSIQDTGKGIAPEDLNHVFDPFFTTKSSGTGLGLSVSHGIIQEHGGMVDVESEEGMGTVFHMYFPMLEETVVI